MMNIFTSKSAVSCSYGQVSRNISGDISVLDMLPVCHRVFPQRFEVLSIAWCMQVVSSGRHR